MTEERWRRVEEIYHAALALPAGARASYVRDACRGDSTLAVEVESLLAADADAATFLETPAAVKAASVMADLVGRQIGHYVVGARLGAGGMGEVYRARDTKLKRDVAIKVLSSDFTRDIERLARFRREAETLAALNAPNIASIYGIEDVDGVPALVLELVDGQTLEDRIARGPIPLDEALRIARQIADALAAAHEQGIVHRDLKPANVALASDGKVKVLDFGVSKTMSLDAATEPGVILGTAAYMAPEQAKGKSVGKRADIWAFGAVLYEMLSGRRAFGGDATTETLALVISAEPDWSMLPPHTPVSVHRLLRRCLQKDPGRRLADIEDARFDLDDALTGPPGVDVSMVRVQAKRSVGRWLAMSVVAIALVAAGVVFSRTWRSGASGDSAMRFEVSPPEGAQLATGQMLSPDGRTLAFLATLAGKTSVWIRPLDSLTAQPVQGTEGAVRPFWSPDGRYIAFFAQRKLKKVAASGGAAPQVICDTAGLAGAWNAENVILIGGEDRHPLMRVSAGGGEPAPEGVLDLSRNERTQDVPEFLPDGRHYLYLSRADGNNLVFAGVLGSRERHALPGVRSAARYSRSGHLLFIRDSGALMAQPFDVVRQQTTGDPIQVAEQVTGGLALSATGGLSYYSLVREGASLGLFDRSGRLIRMLSVAHGQYSFPKLSPDGTQAALMAVDAAFQSDIWLIDLTRDVPSRFTSAPGLNVIPVWSSDGKSIAFRSNRTGSWGIYRRPADGGAPDELILKSPSTDTPTGFSPDGKLLLFDRDMGPNGNWDIWALPLTGDRTPFPVVATPFMDAQAVFSPDGKWIAYESDDAGGVRQIYVQPFPADGRRIRLSTTSGSGARWASDGSEVIYSTSDNHVMAVRLKVSGREMHAESPRELFVRAPAGGNPQSFAVDATGTRFLFPVPDASYKQPRITVVLNWASALPR